MKYPTPPVDKMICLTQHAQCKSSAPDTHFGLINSSGTETQTLNTQNKKKLYHTLKSTEKNPDKLRTAIVNKISS